MRSKLGTLVFLAALACAVTGPELARADQSSEVKLRRWYLGVEAAGGQRDRWDVYGIPDKPSGAVSDRGEGGTFLFGYRFGGRFLLGLQVVTLNFDITDSEDQMRDITALVTGTILFREHETLQPFLIGGFGGGGASQTGPDGYTAAFGTAVLAGAGLQLRLSSRFSLEVEVAADFKNFHEVQDRPDGGPESDWSVKTSHLGSHWGLGLMVWF